MQSIRIIVVAAALCTWISIAGLVRVNNLTIDLATTSASSPCDMPNAPLLQNLTASRNLANETRSIVKDEARSPSSPSPEQTRKPPLPPIHLNSSWIGNQWIPPPGYRLYSTREIQAYFQQHSILWVGDSTARRNYGTMYGILNATDNPDDVEIQNLDHPSVVDMNKMTLERKIPYPETCNKHGYNLCRQIPNASNDNKLYNHMDATCLASLANMTVNQTSTFWNDLQDYSLVIFVIGPWELRDRCGPDELGWKKRVDLFLNALYERAKNSNTTFVWRTWGNIDYDIERKAKLSWKKAYMYNEYIKQRIEEHEQGCNKSCAAISYIDWGQAMFPRAFPRSKRIRGDMQAHFGLEARLTFVQMLINHLVERERGQQHVTEFEQ